MTETAGPANRDQTQAMALKIAHELLLKQGWRFSAADIGKTAKEIIYALDALPSTPNVG